jgi:uncharacterized integral membrane protein
MRFDPLPRETLNPELTKKYRALEARKSENRVKYLRKFLLVLFPLVLSILILYASTSVSIALLSTIGSLAFIVTLLVFVFFGILSLLPAIIFPLDPLDKAFEKVYKALEYLESSPDDPLIQSQVHRLLSSALVQLQEDGARQALLKEADDLLQKTFEDLESRVIPAPASDDLKNVVETLAELLTSPSLARMAQLNTRIEAMLQPSSAPSSEISFRSAFNRFNQSKIGKLIEAFVAGPILTIIFAFFYSAFTQQDFNAFVKNNPNIIIIGAIGASGAILAYLKTTK